MSFQYSDQDDLRRVYPGYGGYLSRIQVVDWVNDSGNLWSAYPGTKPALVYFDGVEGTSDIALDAALKYYYTTGTDKLQIYSTADPNDDVIITIGEDKDTLVNHQLAAASMELSGMLDARFPRPLPKTTDSTGTTPQYDAIIIRVTCLIALKNMMIAAGDFEQAEKIANEITNVDATGIVENINSGNYKLNFEITEAENGIITETYTGSMELLQIYGDYSGSLYDRLRVKISKGGSYGTAEFTVYYTDGTQLYGNSMTAVTITGGMDYLGFGLYARFYGTTANLSDSWVVEVGNMPATNRAIGSVSLHR